MTKTKNHLSGARVYLSGPMDFVASRAREKQFGWRNRVSQFLRSYGVTVFDPWNKPSIRGLHEYGREDVRTLTRRGEWTFAGDSDGIRVRGQIAAEFWETLHIDLRMVDVSDFVIAYCPTNIYSVGTVNEIVVARGERKPVLFVSPSVVFPTLRKLERELQDNEQAKLLLARLRAELPIKENDGGTPSLWYLPLVGSENFFDSFGFTIKKYRRRFGWKLETELDERENRRPPQRPLLPFLTSVAAGQLPRRWDFRSKRLVPDDDWLLMDEALKTRG